MSSSIGRMKFPTEWKHQRCSRKTTNQSDIHHILHALLLPSLILVAWQHVALQLLVTCGNLGFLLRCIQWVTKGSMQTVEEPKAPSTICIKLLAPGDLWICSCRVNSHVKITPFRGMNFSAVTAKSGAFVKPHPGLQEGAHCKGPLRRHVQRSSETLEL